MAVMLKINGSSRTVPAEPDTPLLHVLRNDLALNGAKYGVRARAMRRLHGAARRARGALLRDAGRYGREDCHRPCNRKAHPATGR